MDQNNHLKVTIDGKEHDFYISNTNLLALGAGADVFYNGSLYHARLTTYVLSTDTDFFMDQSPKIELIKKEN